MFNLWVDFLWFCKRLLIIREIIVLIVLIIGYIEVYDEIFYLYLDGIY